MYGFYLSQEGPRRSGPHSFRPHAANRAFSFHFTRVECTVGRVGVGGVIRAALHAHAAPGHRAAARVRHKTRDVTLPAVAHTLVAPPRAGHARRTDPERAVPKKVCM